MSTNYAFIGAGNMAKAMIGGILSSGLAAPDCVTASNPSAPKLDALKEEFGIRTIQQGNAAAAAQADVLVLSVKPYLYETVIAEIRDVVKPETIVVMIAAGQTLSANETRMYTCLSKLWLMRLFCTECRANRRIHLPHSRCSALQKWYWKLVCTQANSKTTSALPAERPLKQSLLWRPAACDPL